MNRIVRLYASGLSCEEIGAIVGCCAETARKVLITNGINRRPKTYKKPIPIPRWNEYFSSRIKRDGDCILWTGDRDKGGYGRVTVAFTQGIHFAHRLSWFLANGSFDLKCRILHRCDVRACVNPKHLWVGTQIDNIKDMCAKGRQRGVSRRGMEHPTSKLTDAEVKKMRAARAKLNVPYYKIAKLFNVSTMTAYRAVTSKAWSHIQ